MVASDNGRKPIVPPMADVPREIARGITEAAVELIPGGGVITKILRVATPPKSQTERERWQQAISGRTNQNADRLDEHERLLNPTTTLTGMAAQLAVALARACPDGLGHKKFDLDGLCGLFPEVDRAAIEDATADLEILGLAQRERFIGGYWFIRLTPVFYVQLDHQIMGWDSTADAIAVAGLLLEEDVSGAASDLHNKTGWEKRRFNPAFRIVLGMFPEGRISQEISARLSFPLCASPSRGPSRIETFCY